MHNAQRQNHSYTRCVVPSGEGSHFQWWTNQQTNLFRCWFCCGCWYCCCCYHYMLSLSLLSSLLLLRAVTYKERYQLVDIANEGIFDKKNCSIANWTPPPTTPPPTTPPPTPRHTKKTMANRPNDPSPTQKPQPRPTATSWQLQTTVSDSLSELPATTNEASQAPKTSSEESPTEPSKQRDLHWLLPFASILLVLVLALATVIVLCTKSRLQVLFKKAASSDIKGE